MLLYTAWAFIISDWLRLTEQKYYEDFIFLS